MNQPEPPFVFWLDPDMMQNSNTDSFSISLLSILVILHAVDEDLLL